jgi:hypothetical protein
MQIKKKTFGLHFQGQRIMEEKKNSIKQVASGLALVS